jgi:hypothetical protein
MEKKSSLAFLKSVGVSLLVIFILDRIIRVIVGAYISIAA